MFLLPLSSCHAFSEERAGARNNFSLPFPYNLTLPETPAFRSRTSNRESCGVSIVQWEACEGFMILSLVTSKASPHNPRVSYCPSFICHVRIHSNTVPSASSFAWNFSRCFVSWSPGSLSRQWFEFCSQFSTKVMTTCLEHFQLMLLRKRPGMMWKVRRLHFQHIGDSLMQLYISKQLAFFNIRPWEPTELHGQSHRFWWTTHRGNLKHKSVSNSPNVKFQKRIDGSTDNVLKFAGVLAPLLWARCHVRRWIGGYSWSVRSSASLDRLTHALGQLELLLFLA